MAKLRVRRVRQVVEYSTSCCLFLVTAPPLWRVSKTLRRLLLETGWHRPFPGLEVSVHLRLRLDGGGGARLMPQIMED